MKEPGKFITFEGIDGAGKSSHIAAVANLLEHHGVRVVLTREPGGTAIGERIRELLLSREASVLPETEAMLVFAARLQHLDEVILPALAGGTWVLCDRFTDATYAYQGGGRQVPFERLAVLKEWVQKGRDPDVTLLFDATVETASERMAGRRPLDRFEAEAQDFHHRVREAYRALARQEPTRIIVIDSGRALEDVRNDVETALRNRFPSVFRPAHGASALPAEPHP